MSGEEVLLRPGLPWPNWSAATTEGARRALGAIIEAAGLDRKWAGLTEAEDRVRRAVLDLYARLGRAPGAAELAAAAGMSPEELREQLARLGERDLVVLGGPEGEIAGAYPFTERATAHRVRLGDRVLNAMCAIDALGAGAMCGADTVVESACMGCGTGIRIATREGGAALEGFSPPGALVWSGIQHDGLCSATSLCTVLGFFCC
ncbi:MAG: organomercurial lyase, partial [bacterium]